MKKALKIILGIIVTAIILYFCILALRNVDFKSIQHLNINYFYMFSAVLAFVGSNYAKAAMYTHGIARGMRFFDAVRFNSVGNAVNMVLPLKAGEGFKLTLFPKEYSVTDRGKLFGLSSALDAVSIIVFAILATIIFPFKNNSPIIYNLNMKGLVIASSIVIGLLAAAGIGIAFCFKSTRKQLLALFEGDIFWALFYNMVSWTLLYISKVFGLMSLDYFTFLPAVEVALLVTVTTNIAIIIPSSPGALGLFEYAVFLALIQAGYDDAHSLTAGLLLHLTQYIGLLPMGLYYYFKGLRKKNA